MAQTNFTPISLYYSTTAAAVPSASNLVAGELAINTQDGKLFYKDAAGVVQTIASKDGNSGTFTNLTVSGVASFADGTVSLPSITNIGDTNTGIFFPAADTIAFTEGGVESMRIDASGQVGIGTTSPVGKVQITGASSGRYLTLDAPDRGGYITFSAAGTAFADFGSQFGLTGSGSATNLFLTTRSTNNLIFGTADTERMRIDSSGNVGIGRTPDQRFQIAAPSAVQSDMFVGTTRTLTLYADATQTIIGAPTAIPMAFRTNDTERMRIDSGGNVGIGTTSPARLLDISKSSSSGSSSLFPCLMVRNTLGTQGNASTTFNFARIDVQSGNGVVFGDIGTRYDTGYDGMYLGTESNHPVLFQTNGTERMRIDSSGNLLVGTTGISTGTFKGIQNAAGGADANYLSRNSSGTANRQWSFGMNSSDQYVVYGYNTTTFNSGAYIAWGGTSWTASSDERLKDIIEPITDAVNKVSTLRTVIGKYKTDEESTRRAFLIAQDVQAVLPEAVDASNPEKLGVSYTDVIPLLVASIKELKATVDAQAAQIAALESK